MKRKFSDYLDASGNWQIVIDGDEDSWWYYKGDAIDKILELIDSESEKGLSKYKYEGESITSEELRYELENLSEEDFYTILDEIKKKCDFSGDIKLYNISDENEIDFLKDEEGYSLDYD